jgi:hypothetical protein
MASIFISIDPTHEEGPQRMVCAAPDYGIKDVFLVVR